MPFPEFEPGKKRILFFSRGRGCGHAIPDIEIVKELQKLRDDVDVRFVSYATGARTLEAHGFSIIDVDLPSNGEDAAMTALSGRLIRWLQPDLVVSHEEFAVLPVAKIFDRPTVFITEWFIEPWTYRMRALQFADKILFMGQPAVFDEPPWVQERVEYLGWFVRKFNYTLEDRVRARKELGWGEDEFVVIILPGSWPEEVVRIKDLVVEAFDLLDRSPKRLVWLAGGDHQFIQATLGHRSDVLVIEQDWRIDRLMVASDIALTKSNRMTVLELRSLGVPHLSLTNGLNSLDDRIIQRLDSSVLLPLSEIRPAELVRRVTKQLRIRIAHGAVPGAAVASSIAGRVAEVLSQVRQDQ